MKNILLGYVLLLMVVSCVGQQKRSESLSDEQGIELVQADSVLTSDDGLSDTLIVVDEVVPTTADASFIDFLYYFTSDEEFQHSRILFPVSFYDDTAVTRLTSDEWVFDPMFDSDQLYTVIFDKEEDLELENGSSTTSVQIDWIYLSDYHIRRYYFELKDDRWYLEAVNKEKMTRTKHGGEDFYDFYHRFLPTRFSSLKDCRNLYCSLLWILRTSSLFLKPHWKKDSGLLSVLQCRQKNLPISVTDRKRLKSRIQKS